MKRENKIKSTVNDLDTRSDIMQIMTLALMDNIVPSLFVTWS